MSQDKGKNQGSSGSPNSKNPIDTVKPPANPPPRPLKVHRNDSIEHSGDPKPSQKPKK